MGQPEAQEQVAVLVAAFSRETISDATVALYVTKLSDIDGPLLAAAVNRLVDSSRFFPTIAELREMAARLAGLLPPSPAEALAIVRRANVSESIYRRDGSFAYTEHYWRWPDDALPSDVDFCQRLIEKLGDPIDFRTDEQHFGWESGFQKTAEKELVSLTREALKDLSLARLPAHDLRALPPRLEAS